GSAACSSSLSAKRSLSIAPTNPSSVVLPAVANMGMRPVEKVTKVVTNVAGSGTASSDAMTGDMNTPAPPGMPGDSSPRIITGGISTAISVIVIGRPSSRQVETVTSITPMVATFLFGTVPSTIEARATCGRRPRSRSAEIRFTGSVSYDPPVPKPVTYTVAKYFQICGHVRLVVARTNSSIAADQTVATMARFSDVRP